MRGTGFHLGQTTFDRIDFTSGGSMRGGRSFSSSLRLLVEKDIGAKSTIILEKNLAEVDDIYIRWEQQVARTFFVNGFWTTEQQGRYLSIGSAFGLEFQVRWEMDL